MTDEVKQVPKENVEPIIETVDKPISLYDKTEAIVTRQEEANKKTEELLTRQETLHANERLAGTGGGHIETRSVEETASRNRIKAVGLAGGAQWAKDMDKQDGKI